MIDAQPITRNKTLMLTTPPADECPRCATIRLALRSPLLGTVSAGRLSAPLDYDPDHPMNFDGYVWPVTRSTLTADGVASGDYLLISIDTDDLTMPGRYLGRVVVTIDREGTTYIGRHHGSYLKDDRGVYCTSGMEVIGLVASILKGL